MCLLAIENKKYIKTSRKEIPVKNRFVKTFVKILGAILLLGVLLLVFGPFLIPVNPLEGLAFIQEVAREESKFVTIPFDGTDGLDIHYLEGGSTSNDLPYTFVLLHGSNFNAFTWNEVIDDFGKYGRVVAYDQIPYGLSEKLVEGDWSDAGTFESLHRANQMLKE